MVLEGAQGGGRLWSAAFTARVIVRERVAAGATARQQEGNSTNGGDFQAHALHHPRLPAACNTPLLPSRRHFSLVVRRFPRCLLQHRLQEQQQSAINIKCATKSSLHLHQLLIRLYSRTVLLGANFHNSVLFCYSTNIILC